MWTKIIINDNHDYSINNDKPHVVFIETNNAVAKDFYQQYYLSDNFYVSQNDETPAIENVDEYSCFDDRKILSNLRLNVHVYNTDRLVNLGYLKASENQSVWTMFRIKPKYYTSKQQHYCVYYECNTVEADRIRKIHSRVYDHYEFAGNIEPDVLNTEYYRDSNNRYHQVYHKEDFKKLSKLVNY